MVKGIDIGMEKGIEVGMEKGAQERSHEIARNLLDILDDTTIAAMTGLTEAQIKQLRI